MYDKEAVKIHFTLQFTNLCTIFNKALSNKAISICSTHSKQQIKQLSYCNIQFQNNKRWGHSFNSPLFFIQRNIRHLPII